MPAACCLWDRVLKMTICQSTVCSHIWQFSSVGRHLIITLPPLVRTIRENLNTKSLKCWSTSLLSWLSYFLNRHVFAHFEAWSSYSNKAQKNEICWGQVLGPYVIGYGSTVIRSWKEKSLDLEKQNKASIPTPTPFPRLPQTDKPGDLRAGEELSTPWSSELRGSDSWGELPGQTQEFGDSAGGGALWEIPATTLWGCSLDICWPQNPLEPPSPLDNGTSNHFLEAALYC